jgi:hypothetical protein
LTKVYAAAAAHDPYAVPVIDDMIRVPDDVMHAAKPEHIALGCAPSKNLYGHRSLHVEDPRELPMRSAGMHMHFGIVPSYGWSASIERKNSMIRMLDRVIGTIMTSMFQGLEGTTRPARRELYGRAGEYRCTPYGREWRTPGPAIGAHPATFNLIWDLARIAAHWGLQGLEYLWDTTDDETRQVINEYDVPLAQKIIERNQRVLMWALGKRYGFDGAYSGKGTPEPTIRVILEGLGAFASAPRDLVRNWKLHGGWINHADAEGCNWKSARRMILEGSKI